MYFVEGFSVQPPDLKEQLIDLFKIFGFNEKFIDQIITIHKNYLKQGKIRGNLCQIFIHPSIVDEIAYLCLKKGGEPLNGFGLEMVPIGVEQITDENEEKIEHLNKETVNRALQRPSVSKFLIIMANKSTAIVINSQRY